MTTLLLFGYFFHRTWESAAHLTEARTQLLKAMILIELANAISVDSLGHHIWQAGVFKNKIWCAVGASFLLQLLMLNTPGLNSAFDVSALRTLDWAFAIPFHSDGFHHSEDCELDCQLQTEGSWKDLYLRPGKNGLKATEKRAEDLKHDVHESYAKVDHRNCSNNCSNVSGRCLCFQRPSSSVRSRVPLDQN